MTTQLTPLQNFRTEEQQQAEQSGLSGIVHYRLSSPTLCEMTFSVVWIMRVTFVSFLNKSSYFN